MSARSFWWCLLVLVSLYPDFKAKATPVIRLNRVNLNALIYLLHHAEVDRSNSAFVAVLRY